MINEQKHKTKLRIKTTHILVYCHSCLSVKTCGYVTFSNKSARQWINGDNPHKIKRALMLTTIT